MPVPAWLAAAADGDEDSAARSTEVLGGNVRVAHKVEDPFHHTGQHYPTKMRTVRLLGMRFNPIVTCGALVRACVPGFAEDAVPKHCIFETFRPNRHQTPFVFPCMMTNDKQSEMGGGTSYVYIRLSFRKGRAHGRRHPQPVSLPAGG